MDVRITSCQPANGELEAWLIAVCGGRGADQSARRAGTESRSRTMRIPAGESGPARPGLSQLTPNTRHAVGARAQRFLGFAQASIMKFGRSLTKPTSRRRSSTPAVVATRRRDLTSAPVDPFGDSRPVERCSARDENKRRYLSCSEPELLVPRPRSIPVDGLTVSVALSPGEPGQ
jgi:hypothetical protein